MSKGLSHDATAIMWLRMNKMCESSNKFAQTQLLTSLFEV